VSLSALQAIKQAACDASRLCLPAGRPPTVLLRPVSTTMGRLDAKDVKVLTEWRNRYVTSFLTEFQATEDRTADWLTHSVGPDGTRILFMVDGISDAITIGYMGLAFIDWDRHYGEADAIVRGLPAERGVMRQALVALLTWAKESLGLTSFGVRVRSDNPAISFYAALGFHAVRRVPLRRCKEMDSGIIVWSEDSGAPVEEPFLVHMKLASGATDATP
jgi:RimJ/RimL family protein N-acetyltransferase